MTVKQCVEKTKSMLEEEDEKKISKSYTKFYITMFVAFVIVLYWVWCIVSAVSSKIALGVELVLSVAFIVTLDTFLKMASESVKAYKGIKTFGKLLVLFIILLIATAVAVFLLKTNYIL
mgnify:CR=1 FL=1